LLLLHLILDLLDFGLSFVFFDFVLYFNFSFIVSFIGFLLWLGC
jgi:hypothetical protein